MSLSAPSPREQRLFAVAVAVSEDLSPDGGLTARPREYEQRVVGFFDRRLLAQRSD